MGLLAGVAMSGLLAGAHPERVRRLAIGGYPLFERNTILESLGMMPEWPEVEARHQRCLDGEWDAYWESFPLPLPDAVKAGLSSRNDLGSISACAVAVHLDPMDWSVPSGVETLAYWGEDEIFNELNARAAADQPIRTATVRGGHAEAFFPSGPALAAVTAFLDAE